MARNKLLNDYMEMTGQSIQEIMGGGIAFGPAFIDELMKKCLAEKKRIIWKDEFEKGEDAMSYSLENIEPK